MTLHWRPSPLALALATTAATALILAILTHHPALIAFAAPLLAALATTPHHPRPTHLTLHPTRGTERCFENEPAHITLHATTNGSCDHVTLRLLPTPQLSAAHLPAPAAPEPHPSEPHPLEAHPLEPHPLEARILDPQVLIYDKCKSAGAGAQGAGSAAMGSVGAGAVGAGAEGAGSAGGGSVVAEWIVRFGRWGRFEPEVQVTARAAGGLLVAVGRVRPAEIRVYPRADSLRVAVRPEHLPERIGVHIGRRRGEGVEFWGIRPYVPGDPLGRINWPVSVRLGRWHVTERMAERASEVVALIDTFPTTAGARESLDLAVRGAAEIVQAALKRGDRAGVLALGGVTRWLGPDVGRRQFYRIVDAVLDAVPERVSTRPTGGRVPRGALPPGACVVAFSPLLDARIGLALQDIRHRGHAVVTVDVLRRAPAETDDPLVQRMWRLGRRGLHRDLASLNIPVVEWAEGSSLDAALYQIAQRPLAAGRPPR